jgi:SAM-dependent methyltransferase
MASLSALGTFPVRTLPGLLKTLFIDRAESRSFSRSTRVIRTYFRHLYERTMSEAYGRATSEIVEALGNGGSVLDCGANRGGMYRTIAAKLPQFDRSSYFGVEWDQRAVQAAQADGLQVTASDLNREIHFPDSTFACVFGLSVLEHLLNGCRYLKECHRVLQPGGRARRPDPEHQHLLHSGPDPHGEDAINRSAPGLGRACQKGRAS